MNVHHAAAATPSHQVESGASFPRASHGLIMTEERLPFTVKLVQSADDLSKAVHIRHAAYARHVPEFAETLRLPEPADLEDDAVVLLAESKFDGSPLGTVRIQTNRLKPLSVEQSVELPLWLKGRQLAEVSRLGIDEGRIGRLVKIVLIKACFQYCDQNGIEWAVVTGRAPIDRQYEQLLFEDVFPERGYIPMRHVNNLPHRVLAFEIDSGHARWTEAGHPMLKFFSYTRHADIDLSRRRAARSRNVALAQNFSAGVHVS